MDLKQKLNEKNREFSNLVKEKNKEIRSLKAKVSKLEKRLKEKNEKFIAKRKELNKEISKLKREVLKLQKRLLKKNTQITENIAPLKQKISSLEKKLSKQENRLKKKSQQLISLNKEKKALEKENQELLNNIKDLEILIKQKDELISHLKHRIDYEMQLELLDKDNKIKELEEELSKLRLECAKKDAVINLLEQPEYDYKQIVSLDFKDIKYRLVGPPEYATIEGIVIKIKNLSNDNLHNLTADIVIEGSSARHVIENYHLKNILSSKEHFEKTIPIFKNLKSRGVFKISIWLKCKESDKEILEQSKIITI